MKEDLHMTRAEILERVSLLLGDVLDLEDVKLTEASTASDFEDWDSVNHVRLLIRVEQELGFQFNSDEVGMVENVGELVTLIGTKLPKA
jgi:acyl carrier protein